MLRFFITINPIQWNAPLQKPTLRGIGFFFCISRLPNRKARVPQDKIKTTITR